MPGAPHRIRRIRWQIRTSSQTGAFALRQSLHDRGQDLLLSVCESVFDEVAGMEKVLHIPKLELHFCVSSEEEFFALLPVLLDRQLRQQLTRISGIESPLSTLETTLEQTRWDVLLSYLQTGSVLWSSASIEPTTLAVELRETCQQERARLLEYLLDRPETAPFYSRLLSLLDPSEIVHLTETLLERFIPRSQQIMTEFVDFLLASNDSPLKRPIQWQLIATLLSTSCHHPDTPIAAAIAAALSILEIDRAAFQNSLPERFALSFFPQLQDNSSENLAIDPEIPPQLPRTNPATTPITATEEIRNTPPETPAATPISERVEIPPLSPENPSIERSILGIGIPETEAQEYLDNLNPIPPITDTEEIPVRSPESPSDETVAFLWTVTPINRAEFPLLVNYAGLVLSHPFIPPLFEATGIIETNREAIASSRLPKAAALLHFLATGRSTVHEYELGLIKVLLGLDPEVPLGVAEGWLEESDRTEAETVLRSILNYWTVLKNTSIEGLRVSFLQRSGLLGKIDHGRSLQVEHRAFDLLLDRLPWGIGIIKLAWMTSPLYVEWQTF